MSYSSLRKELAQSIAQGEKSKSSHWKKHTEKSIIDSDYFISGVDGFSNRSRRFMGSQIIHKRNLKKLFPDARKTIDSIKFKSAVNICNLQNRSIDSCVARHVFTLDLLQDFPNISHDVTCVIGDGQANFVSLALERNFSRKIISINLPEVLLSDLELIEKLPFLYDTQVSIAKTEKDVEDFLQSPTKKLLLISAHLVAILTNVGIDLFVNIASFQEMNRNLIAEYFRIISSNKSLLYSCNRISKELYGGEINDFFEYPWGESEILLDEECKWHSAFYSLRTITLYKKHSFDGVTQHRLVKY